MKSSPTPHCSVNNTRQPSFLPKPHTQFTTPKQSLTQHRETIHAGSQQARAPLQPSTSGQGFTPSYKPCSFKISPLPHILSHHSINLPRLHSDTPHPLTPFHTMIKAQQAPRHAQYTNPQIPTSLNFPLPFTDPHFYAFTHLQKEAK